MTLIQEAYTSQKCSQCYSQLEAWKSRRLGAPPPCTTTSKRGRDAALAVHPGGVCYPTTRCARAKEIHGVRVCLSCRGKDDQKKLRFFIKNRRFLGARYVFTLEIRTTPEYERTQNAQEQSKTPSEKAPLKYIAAVSSRYPLT